MKKMLTRREYLQLLGSSAIGVAYMTTPLGKLFQAIVDGTIAKAYAQDLGLGVKNHVAIVFGGAPPSWGLSTFLRPRGPLDAFIPNTSVVNAIIGSAYTGVGDLYSSKYQPGNASANSLCRYVTEKIILKDAAGRDLPIYLPGIWKQSIPLSSGSDDWIEMSTVLQNGMLMRGVDMLLDLQHQVGPQRMVRPDLSLPSLSGYVADRSNLAVPAVTTMLTNNGFASGQGLSAVNADLTAGNPLQQILGPFIESDPKVIASSSNRALMKGMMDLALKDMGEYAKSNKPGAEALYRNHAKAEAMLSKNLSNFAAEYSALHQKYVVLAQRCATPIENVTLSHSDFGIHVPGSTGFDPVGQKYTYIPTNGVDATKVAHYGVQGAIAEYLISRDLCSSITMAGASANTGKLAVTSDEHAFANRQASAISYNFWARNLMAFINELKNVFEANGRWEHTVIQIGSEYGRSPVNTALQDTGGGSDHASSAGWSMTFSGDIREPVFIGNVALGDYPSTHTRLGTWGVAAPVKNLSSGATFTLDINHMAGAVANVLGVPNPIRNTATIIEKVNGIWKSKLEKPKNV